ncbi:hypothetical protein NO135_20190, partial [Clostridioides difficile]|nr:hypothetical protein [Clostridioides difficile]
MLAGQPLVKTLRAGMLALCALAALAAAPAHAAPLYPGEDALYAKAADEGLVVSFDTGPEWANWKALFAEFRKRYPKVEITYNDIGSAATVVALDKSRRRPQA